MTRAKKQHYVPQFYLRKFSSDNTKVYVFDKVDNKIFLSNVDSIACTKNFYDNEYLNNMAGQQIIEKTFSGFESIISKTFTDLINRLNINKFHGFTVKDRVDLAEHIWYQMIRNPEARIIGKEIYDGLNKISNSTFEDEWSDKDRHLKFILSFENIEKTIRNLCCRIWITIENKTDQYFYTSDNPVVKKVHWGKNHSAIEMFFPLTPKFALWILDRENFLELEQWENCIKPFKKVEFVEFYNKLQIQQCTRQIYSMESDFRDAREFICKHPGIRNIDRQRLEY